MVIRVTHYIYFNEQQTVDVEKEIVVAETNKMCNFAIL